LTVLAQRRNVAREDTFKLRLGVALRIETCLAAVLRAE